MRTNGIVGIFEYQNFLKKNLRQTFHLRKLGYYNTVEHIKIHNNCSFHVLVSLTHFFSPFSSSLECISAPPLSSQLLYIFTLTSHASFIFSPCLPLSFPVRSLSLSICPGGCGYFQCVWTPCFQEISCQSK